MTNTGIPYEQLARQIFEEILRLDGVENVVVRHDVKLPGKSRGADGEPMQHQIDVYWEFELAGVLYKTAIQAKDWGDNVPQGEVLKFKGVLDDLPGQPRGIMVARTGFQSGAKTFADAHGIELYEMRVPTQHDLAGRFTKLGLNLTAFTPSMEIVGVEPDKEWVRATVPGFSENVGFGPDARNVNLYAAGGTVVTALYDLIDSYVPKDNTELPLTEIRHVFDSPTFIDTTNPNLPRLKLLSVTAKISVSKTEIRQEFDFSDMLTYVLRTISGDKTYFVDSDGHVRKG